MTTHFLPECVKIDDILNDFVKITLHDGTIIKGKLKIIKDVDNPDKIYVGLYGHKLYCADSMDSIVEYIGDCKMQNEYETDKWKQKPVKKAIVGDSVVIDGNIFTIMGISLSPDTGLLQFELSLDKGFGTSSRRMVVPAHVFDYVLKPR